jgi:hypothetical protein
MFSQKFVVFHRHFEQKQIRQAGEVWRSSVIVVFFHEAVYPAPQVRPAVFRQQLTSLADILLIMDMAAPLFKFSPGRKPSLLHTSQDLVWTTVCVRQHPAITGTRTRPYTKTGPPTYQYTSAIGSAASLGNGNSQTTHR